MTEEIDITPLNEEGARRLTEELKSGFDFWGRKLLEAYRRRAWQVLGYQTFVEYADAELNLSRTRAYKALDAAKVSLSLLPELGEKVVTKISGSQKEILIEVPEHQRVEFYKEAQKKANEKQTQVTARLLKQLIREKEEGDNSSTSKSASSNSLSWFKEQLKVKTEELEQAREENARLRAENELLQGLLARHQ